MGSTYKKALPFGKPIFRLEKQVQFDNQGKKAARDMINIFHDVCIEIELVQE